MSTEKNVENIKSVYCFGSSNVLDDLHSLDAPSILGGKGAGLYEMCRLGIPVPPGFVISTRECAYFKDHGCISDGLEEKIRDGILHIEKATNSVFGSFREGNKPLLLSVRSGAKVSMPGMMDTVLNIGLCDANLNFFADAFGDKVFALDSYRRLIQVYASVVLGVPIYRFEEALSDIKMSLGFLKDTDLCVENWEKFLVVAKKITVDFVGQWVPDDPYKQVKDAVIAVMMSWNNERAKAYRKINGISDEGGTAVTVQAMVFGNLNDNSSTGVAFTRNPSTGEKGIYGEYMVKAQGEDIVSGVRTPQHIVKQFDDDVNSMEGRMPDKFAELNNVLRRLEVHYKDMQDVEFTIEDGKLWILQTRAGKRYIGAGIKIVHDLVMEGIISKEEAILRIDVHSIPRLLHPHIASNMIHSAIAVGLPASPGLGSGAVVFTARDAEIFVKDGKKVILVREETSPEDINGMSVSSALLTSRGGMTSHAAVVARGMGVPCVVGCDSFYIDETAKIAKTKDGPILKEGDVISIDGATGAVFLGEVPIELPILGDEFSAVLTWADEIATTKVRANAETIPELNVAMKFGCKGVGLCRTEHMFFEESRLFAMRLAILSERKDSGVYLANLAKMQKEDFVEIFKAMKGLPINVRLLDPPLHEFLPNKEDVIESLSLAGGMGVVAVKMRIARLKEHNPMLGNRGVRLGISFPELYRAQIRSILSAYAECFHLGVSVDLELMIPLVYSEKELLFVRDMIMSVKSEVESSSGCSIELKIGTMIELPAACVNAGNISLVADYFSFGTNDLTQTTLGISRDDYDSFFASYKSVGVFDKDPFVSIDSSVLHMMQLAVKNGSEVKTGIPYGVCGEHAGDVDSIKHFVEMGCSYVSCSPYRIPVARIAVAQAKILIEKNEKKF